MKRLVKQFGIYREEGLISKKGGAIGNHRLAEGDWALIIAKS